MFCVDCGWAQRKCLKWVNLQDEAAGVLLCPNMEATHLISGLYRKIAAALVSCGLMTFRASSGFFKWASFRSNHTKDLGSQIGNNWVGGNCWAMYNLSVVVWVWVLPDRLGLKIQFNYMYKIIFLRLQHAPATSLNISQQINFIKGYISCIKFSVLKNNSKKK